MTDQAGTSTQPGSEKKIEIVRQGALMKIILNRPRALNALDDEMCRTIAGEIPKIARNPDIYICSMMSAGGRAFCAGGDVRALAGLARQDVAAAKAVLAREYELNWLLDCFSKPCVSFVDGICMGSGAGLSLYNTHRVAGENFKFAMPETAIGLFPDVGVAHVFARLPWPIGLYLGLTGRAIGRADAHWLGLATHCIAAGRFEEIRDGLADSQPVDPLLDERHEEQAPGEVQKERVLIEEFFSPPTLREIISKLKGAGGAAGPWAQATLTDLLSRSPLALAVTDSHIRLARGLDLRETLIQDYRLASHALEGREFAEGLRAALIDKDGKPDWRPGTLDAVTEAMVRAQFAVPAEGDLDLPSRADMQASRV